MILKFWMSHKRSITLVFNACHQFSNHLAGKQIEPDIGQNQAFKSLIVEGLNLDQIWEEIQLQNAPMTKYLGKQIGSLLKEDDFVLWSPPKKKQKSEVWINSCTNKLFRVSKTKKKNSLETGVPMKTMKVVFTLM